MGRVIESGQQPLAGRSATIEEISASHLPGSLAGRSATIGEISGSHLPGSLAQERKFLLL